MEDIDPTFAALILIGFLTGYFFIPLLITLIGRRKSIKKK